MRSRPCWEPGMKENRRVRWSRMSQYQENKDPLAFINGTTVEDRKVRESHYEAGKWRHSERRHRWAETQVSGDTGERRYRWGEAQCSLEKCKWTVKLVQPSPDNDLKALFNDQSSWEDASCPVSLLEIHNTHWSIKGSIQQVLKEIRPFDCVQFLNWALKHQSRMVVLTAKVFDV